MTITEMALSVFLADKALTISGVTQWPYKAVGAGLEVIPRTLIQNCGGSTIRSLTALRVCNVFHKQFAFSLWMQAKHANNANATWGIDGNSGELVDMNTLGIWEPFSVKAQVYKTAIEVWLW